MMIVSLTLKNKPATGKSHVTQAFTTQGRFGMMSARPTQAIQIQLTARA
ncbi:MAG: hypothetical protein ACJAYE_002127 [Candidatus Azotimanducaceae bacterium]|jgi:hypothetical protein